MSRSCKQNTERWK